MDDDPRIWALRRIGPDDPALYWSVRFGWVEGQDADRFTSRERESIAAPAEDRRWVCGLCGQGNPEHPGHVCR